METKPRISQDPEKPLHPALESLGTKAQGDDCRRGRILANLVLSSLLSGLAISSLKLVQYLAVPGEKYGFYLLGEATMMVVTSSANLI